MKTLFEIIPEFLDTSKCSLACELTKEEFSYAVRNNEDNSIISLGVYQYEPARPRSGFPIALQILFHRHSILSKKFVKSCFIYSLPESVLVPFTMFNSQKNQEVLSLVHGDIELENATILTDKLPLRDLYNVYALPSDVQQTIFHQFPASKGIHQYSHFLKKTPPQESVLEVLFYNNKMVVALWKNGACHLVNSYLYRMPEDVSYILLNIAAQWEVPDIPIEIGGFVEENSILYKNIFKYFTTVRFSAPTEPYQLGEYLSQFPAHFFNHIFAFDVCE